MSNGLKTCKKQNSLFLHVVLSDGPYKLVRNKILCFCMLFCPALFSGFPQKKGPQE